MTLACRLKRIRPVKTNNVKDQANIFDTRLKNIVDRPADGHADVTFAVGDQQFGGLRSVLGLHSEVMHRMLFGGLEEARRQTPIRLEQFDHAPTTFQKFLHFMHTGKTDCEDIIDLSDLVEMANYFGVPALSDSCMDVVKNKSISAANSVMLVSFAAKHNLKDLLSEAWAFIGTYTDSALADSKAVVDSLPPVLLKHLFASSASNVSEVYLVKILKEVEPALQAELAPLVRLPLVPGKEMIEVVEPTKLFDVKKCMEAMAWQADPDNVKLTNQITSHRAFSRACIGGGRGAAYGLGGGPSFDIDLNLGWGGKGKQSGGKGGGKDTYREGGEATKGGRGASSASSEDWFAVLQNL